MLIFNKAPAGARPYLSVSQWMLLLEAHQPITDLPGNPALYGATEFVEAAMEVSSLEDFFRDVGAFISKRRKELGLSQSDLAEIAGVHRTYISDVENGKRNFSVAMLHCLATALSVSMPEVIGSAPAPAFTPPAKGEKEAHTEEPQE